MTDYSIFGLMSNVDLATTHEFINGLAHADRVGVEGPMISIYQRNTALGIIAHFDETGKEDFLKAAYETLIYDLSSIRFDPFSRSTSTMSNLHDDVRLAVIKDTLRDVHRAIQSRERQRQDGDPEAESSR